MKRFVKSCVALAATFATLLTASDAAAVDFYLRGPGASLMEHDWDVHENLKFTAEGNNFSIHIDKLDGEFKISNKDWTINYGGQPNDITIGASCIKTGVSDGLNYIASDLANVDVSFTYTPGSDATEIKFIIDGRPIEDIRNEQTSGTLPIIYINVYKDAEHTALENEIIDKDLSHKNYFKFAEYWLDVNGCQWLIDLGAESVGSEDSPLPLQIKARGNYTRTGFSKKPFKLKLDKKQNLLAMTPKKSKHYALLAAADDNKGYLRNMVGFNLGRRIGLPWTPSQQPVEVFINGDYRGLYFLTESIRIGDGRVEIEELEDNAIDPALVSGGYLVELDNYDEENQIRLQEKPYANGDPTLRVTFDTPEEYSSIQYQFIQDQFTAMNDLIGDNDDRIWSYLDLDDAARYYLVCEIISHTEAYHGSTYLFRDRGENQKWHFSPLWDCGNAFNGPTDNHFFNSITYGNTWIHTLIKNKKFRKKVEETWKWFMSNCYNGLLEDIDAFVEHVTPATVYDHRRWSSAPLPNSDNRTPVVDNRDMQSRSRTVKNHLSEKLNWMKNTFGEYSDNLYGEPERDATPAAELPSYITSGTNGILVSPSSADAEYFNLQGIRVENPEPGIYIRVQNGESSKVVVK